MLVKNLFASYTTDPKWEPTDVKGLTADEFAVNPVSFQTVIQGTTDASGNLDVTYIIQVRLGTCEYMFSTRNLYAWFPLLFFVHCLDDGSG